MQLRFARQHTIWYVVLTNVVWVPQRRQ